jgi:hypothetical protein
MENIQNKEEFILLNGILHHKISKMLKGKLLEENWYVNNKLHRENDLPAYINYQSEEKKWFFHGFLHREKKPAVISLNQNDFYLLGTLISSSKFFTHKFSKKIEIIDNNNYETYKDNFKNLYILKNKILHSCNDKPAIVIHGFERQWYYEGVLHRENDLPAIILLDLEKHWLINGQYHRDTLKPAFISIEDGTEYWFNGKYHSLEQAKLRFLKEKINNF